MFIHFECLFVSILDSNVFFADCDEIFIFTQMIDTVGRCKNQSARNDRSSAMLSEIFNSVFQFDRYLKNCVFFF